MMFFGVSHAWLSFCNISIFAVTICILASCRTVSESKYSLINIDRVFLTKAFGDDCVNASSHIPDVYKVGLSGACRVTDGDIQCKTHLPPSLNWAELLEADYAASNTTGSQPDILKKCTELIHDQGVNHAFNDRLAVAMLALLVISIILNVCQLAIALFNESAFGMLIFVPAFLDEVILVVCLGLYLGISNHEVGEYIPDGTRVSDMSILGVGFWMLLAIFCMRAISSPALFIVTVIIVVSIPIAIVSLLLCLCGGSSTVEAGTNYVVHVVHVTTVH
ncbi:hypothetical protein BKA64DRAFT_52818 [Cadophora sp. MPI-SDFR-AT-0126]|nr:hypothetical protein BKA64DRAFT_52818 [Leotiomycetes sp. MPI-SDFR-AT-0126]